MSLDWALEPISAEAPCGPNLDATDDPDFIDYYFDALGRIPERYVTPGMETEGGRRTEDRVFDPKSIDIKAEAERITGLLRRSRDLRLLTLLAQFECLAGRAVQMADAVVTMAALIETFGDDVHPALDGDPSGRREAMQELVQPVAILTGLRYLGLTGATDVTLRKLQVADGRFTPHSGEDNLKLSAMQDALGSAGNRQKVDAVFDALLRMTDALRRIASACQTHPSHPFSPGLDPVLGLLDEMRAAITAARPDLRGAEADLADAPAEMAAPSGPTGTDPSGQPAQASAASPTNVQTTIRSHAEARQALIACETYFQTKEPSSAALLLVRQARQLIGQPLVVALETLLPQESGRAVVSFGPQIGFAIPAARLKALSEQNLPVPSAGETDEEVGDPPSISNAPDVGGVLREVEEFFRQREKSSPVPLLLQRARGYLEKDFQAIIDELIPKTPPPG